MPYIGKKPADIIATAVDTTTGTFSGAITSSDGMIITTADNTDSLILTSTDADASSGPNLNMFRNSSSPADNDFLGNVKFNGRNDNSQDVQYGELEVYAADVSDGTEDGWLNFNVMTGGSNLSYLQIKGGTGVVFNEDSNDIDFRVESNANANMLFVNGGDNNVTMQSTSAGAATAPFILHNASSDANTDVRMYLAPCTTAADRPVILSAKNNGSNVVDFGISTPNGGTPVQRVTVAGSDGTIDVETGNIFFSTAGKGIHLGVTSATASNLLDDYEEGSFTPAYSQSAGNTLQTGRYTKVGNMVTVFIRAQFTQTSSDSALGAITGLPFTVLAETGNGTAVFREFSTTGDLHSATISPNNTATNNLVNFTNTSSFTPGAEIGIGVEFSYRVA
jgi:hypothetical protein